MTAPKKKTTRKAIKPRKAGVAVVTTDGTTVWVNNGEECIGRFGLHAFEVMKIGPDKNDVYQSPSKIEDNMPKLDATAWRAFQERMLSMHRVEVPDTYAPTRFKRQL